MTRKLLANVLVAVLSGAFSLGGMAQDSAGYSAQTIIDGDVGVNVQGVLGVNMAAGDSNLQSNATSVAVSNEGMAQAQVNMLQVIDGGQFRVPDVAVARIEGNAFNNAAGAIGINQSAGAANAQANSVAIGFGAEVTADAELAQSVSGITLPAAMNGEIRETTIAETAFNETHGIVQVNQSAGIGNATANNFALRIDVGAP